METQTTAPPSQEGGGQYSCGCLTLLIFSCIAYGACLYLFQSSQLLQTTTARLTATPLSTTISLILTPPTPTSTVTNTPLPTDTPTVTPFPTITPSMTPTPSPTVTPIPTFAPTSSPTVTPIPTFAPVVQRSPSPIPTAPLSPSFGLFNLLNPPHQVKLPAEPGGVSFKWRWGTGGCVPIPQGFGFEVRIWPETPGFGPMGALNAPVEQALIGCDQTTGDRTLLVPDLRQTPGVQAGNGIGRFVWDVAYVQFEPYNIIAISEPRLFELPGGANQGVALPTFTPIPRSNEVGGVITLIAPENEYTLRTNEEKLQMQWRWSESNNCRYPPAGYGFEVRIWPELPAQPPLGAMGDARTAQANIFCDEFSGIFSYQTFELREVQGIQLGLTAGALRYRWDVVLVRFEPYEVIIQPIAAAFNFPDVQ